MPDLKTLQYPRWIHRGGESKLVQSPEQCDADMDAGWVLSPGDDARSVADTIQEAIAKDVADMPAAPVADEHADSEADAPPAVDAVPEPETLKKRKGKKRA